MTKAEDVLTTGTLLWIKAGHRGVTAVPLEVLTEEQKNVLRAGLDGGRYSLAFDRLGSRKSHYEWAPDSGLPELSVGDIELSPEQKKRLQSPRQTGQKIEWPFTLSSMRRLRSAYESGEVGVDEVREILTSQPWRPWTSAEWRQTRDARIGRECEHCGAEERFVLQHTKQPQKPHKILYQLVGERMDDFSRYVDERKSEIPLPLSEDIDEVPVCPKCGSSRVHYRTRKGSWVCNKTRNYVTCKHEFAEPDRGYDEKDVKVAEKRRVSMLRERYCEETGLRRLAIEIALEEIVEYLEMTHTKTLCSGCAFKEDVLGLRLCEVCGSRYRGKRYAMCKKCRADLARR